MPRLPEMPTREDPQVEEAATRQRERRRLERGRASTIVTGGLGVTTPAVTALKQLTGQ